MLLKTRVENYVTTREIMHAIFGSVCVCVSVCGAIEICTNDSETRASACNILNIVNEFNP